MPPTNQPRFEPAGCGHCAQDRGLPYLGVVPEDSELSEYCWWRWDKVDSTWAGLYNSKMERYLTKDGCMLVFSKTDTVRRSHARAQL